MKITLFWFELSLLPTIRWQYTHTGSGNSLAPNRRQANKGASVFPLSKYICSMMVICPESYLNWYNAKLEI